MIGRPHVVIEMHLHIDIEGVDALEGPDEQSIEIVRRVAQAYREMLPNSPAPEGVTVLGGCVDCIRSVDDATYDGDEPQLDPWVGELMTAVMSAVRDRPL